jgi:hypothetical protein
MGGTVSVALDSLDCLRKENCACGLEVVQSSTEISGTDGKGLART